VKLRSGLDHLRPADLELGRICEAEGVDAVALHPRTARQQYSGEADWSRITRLKEHLRIPVIGNGDVRSPEDAEHMFGQTGCDAVMIGRAAMVDPWIFLRTKAHLTGDRMSEPTLADRCALVRRHVAMLVEDHPPQVLAHRLKVLTRWFTRGLPGGRRLRQQLSQLAESTELLAAIDGFLATSECLPDAAALGTKTVVPNR